LSQVIFGPYVHLDKAVCATQHDPHPSRPCSDGEPRWRQAPSRRRAAPAIRACAGVGRGSQRGAHTEAALDSQDGPRAPWRGQVASAPRSARQASWRPPGCCAPLRCPLPGQGGIRWPPGVTSCLVSQRPPRDAAEALRGALGASPRQRQDDPARGRGFHGPPAARSGAGQQRGHQRPVERHRVDLRPLHGVPGAFPGGHLAPPGPRNRQRGGAAPCRVGTRPSRRRALPSRGGAQAWPPSAAAGGPAAGRPPSSTTAGPADLGGDEGRPARPEGPPPRLQAARARRHAESWRSRLLADCAPFSSGATILFQEPVTCKSAQVRRRTNTCSSPLGTQSRRMCPWSRPSGYAPRVGTQSTPKHGPLSRGSLSTACQCGFGYGRPPHVLYSQFFCWGGGGPPPSLRSCSGRSLTRVTRVWGMFLLN